MTELELSDRETPIEIPRRGRVRPMTREGALRRARMMAGSAGALIRYSIVGGRNGGTNPDASDPASRWRTVLRTLRATCDCSGLQAWCLGFDRRQEDFAPGWDFFNTVSMIAEAQTRAAWFEIIPAPETACLVVYPSIDYDDDGDRDRVGHTGMVVGMVGADGKPLREIKWDPARPAFDRLRVVHCSAGNDRVLDRAIAETDGGAWANRERYKARRHARWGSVFLRYRRFAPSEP